MKPIPHFNISRDDAIYQVFPDLALTASGRLVCVFTECTHHFDRRYTRIVSVVSTDRGRTWSPKRPVTEPLHKLTAADPSWNCARITALRDSRLAVIVDRPTGEDEANGTQSNWLFFSADEGESWQGPLPTPVQGIVPDQIIELTTRPHTGRWTTSAHTSIGGTFRQRLWFSEDQGATWQGPCCVADAPEWKLCEGSVMELPAGELVCFLRENSGRGLDAFRSLSRDGGETWSAPEPFPLPGCHRPVAGRLQSGRVLITYRFLQGGKPHGWATQNFFAALTDVESCLAPSRTDAHARILPLDYDRSPAADLGYSGWVQFPNGEIYVAGYLVDDAPKAHIRGYSLWESDFYC